MAGPVEVVPFENAVRCEQASHMSWHIIEVRTGVQVASVTADADRVWDIVRLINDDVAARREHHQLLSGEGDERLTLDFEAGELAKVSGVRPEQMDGHALIRMVKRLAKLSLAQELEIGRYKAEVEDLDGRADREYQKRIEADAVERRDLFAMAALVGLICTQSSSSFAQDAKNAFDAAEALEAERAVRS